MGEGHVKNRIRHVLDYRKPSFWIVIGAVAVTETLYEAEQQFYSGDAPREGSVVNVRYTFAEDGSFIDIPMVMAEEIQHLWFLSFGNLSSSGYSDSRYSDKVYGPLEQDICMRSGSRRRFLRM